MRSIAKGSAPPRLVEHRKANHSSYGNMPAEAKQQVREALVAEQRGLCCYCMQTISASPEAMKIEHWQCQEHYEHRQLDYSNLLGSCYGNEGQPGDQQHCDTRKGMKNLKFNPANPDHNVGIRIRFDLDGTITSTDTEFNTQLTEILGLNVAALRNRRKAVVETIGEWLRSYRSKHHKQPDKATLEKQRSRWLPTTGNLIAFSGVAVWWIDQRLGSAQS